MQNKKFKNNFKNLNYNDWDKYISNKFDNKKENSYFKNSNFFSNIHTKPLYTNEDLNSLLIDTQYPGQNQFIRAANLTGNVNSEGWTICSLYKGKDLDKINKLILEDIANGSKALLLNFDYSLNSLFMNIDNFKDNLYENLIRDSGIIINNYKDFSILFENVNLSKIALKINAGHASLPIIACLFAWLEENNCPFYDFKGAFHIDPLGFAVRYGNHVSMSVYFRLLASLIPWIEQFSPKNRCIMVDTSVYHDAGANVIQELAIAIATGVFYLKRLSLLGLKVGELQKYFIFNFSTSSNFFLEIAKFRAARKLWYLVLKNWDVNKTMRIQANTSWREITKYDNWNNILRMTSQCFAAVLGGVQSIVVDDFDALLANPNYSGRKNARNIQNILLEEIKSHKVIDPAGGSYYIENLTEELCRKAWDLFREIEQHEGMYTCLINGKIQEMINNNYLQMKEQLILRNFTMVGQNNYVDMNGEIKQLESALGKENLKLFLKSSLEKSLPEFAWQDSEKNLESKKNKIFLNNINDFSDFFNIIKQRAKEGAPLTYLINMFKEFYLIESSPKRKKLSFPVHRLSKTFEEIREKMHYFYLINGFRPKIFMLNYKNNIKYVNRINFCYNFFETLGIEVISNEEGFENIEEAIKSFKNSNTKIMLLCSEDKNYPQLISFINEKKMYLKALNSFVLLAGNPGEQKYNWKSQGIDEFIYQDVDIVNIFNSLENHLGV